MNAPLNEPRSATPFLVKALFKRSTRLAENITTAEKPPALQVEDCYAHFSSAHLQRYHQLVEWPEPDRVHPCYLHMLAFPQHLQLLLSEQVPFPLMGLIHLHNRIEQLRPVFHHEEVVIQSSISGYHPHEKGHVVRIASQATVAEQPVWRSSSDFLHRQRHKHGAKSTPQTKQLEDMFNESEDTQTWRLSSDIGRRYARVSGDFNPIHLWPLTAKILGFKRHIAHGMWSKARCLSALSELSQEQMTCEVEFLKPLFLPAQANFHQLSADNQCYFLLSSQQHQLHHVAGAISF